MQLSDEAPVIPLWINGRAFLTLAPAFQEVRNPANGRLLRRTPLCGAVEAQKAVVAAQSAVAGWEALGEPVRVVLLGALADRLAGYAGHFAGLIAEESGMPIELAEAEVDETVLLLRNARSGGASSLEIGMAGVVGVVGSGEKPLLGSMRVAVPALAGGAAVIFRPAPKAPSALFALAELTARCGFSGGVFSIVHGSDAAVAGLNGLGGIQAVYA